MTRASADCNFSHNDKIKIGHSEFFLHKMRGIAYLSLILCSSLNKIHFEQKSSWVL